MDIRAKENLDREGFAKQPQQPDEWEPWQEVIAWPEAETELTPKSQFGPQAKPSPELLHRQPHADKELCEQRVHRIEIHLVDHLQNRGERVAG